ncbi:hypothetical protein CPT_Piffle_094 [Stenotrophomonas phage Piffle]|uniref:Thoeris anti-defense 2-like domain-containing protein n=1 Tax=Stenotrophomonas phage Piffle TaxID=2859656 RepID=A0AAE8BLH5_9CAUD|nr:hypothetical protein PP762_gp38 [Stenotrophomonas phage Piffle]QYW01948.1 hypothetical protein CPT_Piffle_094 [Stenotrophomonas phage Piffle]
MNVEMAAEGQFEYALIKLKANLAMSRRGWNGANQFVYFVPANEYPAQTGIAQLAFPSNVVPYEGYFALKNAQGKVSVWVPSTGDLLADDWYEFDMAAYFQEQTALPSL